MFEGFRCQPWMAGAWTGAPIARAVVRSKNAISDDNEKGYEQTSLDLRRTEKKFAANEAGCTVLFVCMCVGVNYVYVLVFVCVLVFCCPDTGVLMLEILPRHHFGNLQSQVIPIMFQFGNICMGLAIATFLHQHPVATLNGEEMCQVRQC